MDVTTVGLDVAKQVFQVHGVDAQGKVVIRKQLRRKEVEEYFTKLPACKIGMEACSSSHYWARRLQGLGHTVKLMAPQFVRPYVKTNKNDARDAEAIGEAVSRPSMRFVPVKTAEQQAILALHRARQGFVKARTAQANQLRSLLAEFGMVVPQGTRVLLREVPTILSDEENGLFASVRELFARLLAHVKELDRHVTELEQQITRWHKSNERSCKLEKVPGIGPITASALVATIGDAKAFQHGRQLAAWLGLVPRQHSTGGKIRLHGLSKRGDIYLRTLLIHGARSVLRVAARHTDPTTTWLKRVQTRRNTNIAAVALANKHARIVWALLAHDREYTPAYTTVSA
jgi:transposase